MKVLLLNRFDIVGGAARAAYRLHKGLQASGVESNFLVQEKSSDDPSVLAPQKKLTYEMNKIRRNLDSLPLKLYRHRNPGRWGVGWLPCSVASRVNRLDPDIVHLHLIDGGFVSIRTLPKLQRPIVWTLHDMWAFTGGCHYAGDCTGYKNSCGRCPQLGSKSALDISRIVWKQKARHWEQIDATVVTPSKWLAQCAKESSLFKGWRVEVIPNGLDLAAFSPVDKEVARLLTNLPQDKKLILFGAMGATSDPRKGFKYLEKALSELNLGSWKETAEAVVFGASKPEVSMESGLKVHYLGQLMDDISLRLVYSAADVFVAPSRQENLSNTVMEALACGTPCVAFDVGGMPDLIDSGQNGYLAKPFDGSDLAAGIAWVLADAQRSRFLSQMAREKTENEYSLGLIAKRYANLYNEIRNK